MRKKMYCGFQINTVDADNDLIAGVTGTDSSSTNRLVLYSSLVTSVGSMSFVRITSIKSNTVVMQNLEI